MRWNHCLLLPLVACAAAACKSYEPRPLVPVEVLKSIERSRNLLDLDTDAPAVDAPEFTDAARWMRDRNPDLREARATFLQAWALAQTKTPLPNPEVAVGPLIGSNLGGSGKRLQPLVEFGFTIPLTGRLARQDEVNASRAMEAKTALLVAHRRAYLKLRGAYAQWAVALERRRVQDGLLESARRSLALTERLVEAGEGSAIDVGLMNIEVARWKVELLDTERDLARAEQTLSDLVGVHTRFFRARAAAPLRPEGVEIPAMERARAVLVANNPTLAVERARYETAERELRLEIARQYPDLVIGGSFAGDPGEHKKVWGLTVGIAVPVFDQNQQAIAVAEQERERVRAAYEAQLVRALAELEGAYRRHELAQRKRELLATTLLPRFEANLRTALRALEVGATDALRYLELERALRTVRVELLDAEREITAAVAAVEQVTGAPLALFPGESATDYPVIPETIEAPDRAADGGPRAGEEQE